MPRWKTTLLLVAVFLTGGAAPPTQNLHHHYLKQSLPKYSSQKSKNFTDSITGFSSLSSADIDLKKYLNETYYLKHHVIFLDNPKVSPGGMTFTDKEIGCSSPMWAFTLSRGVEIKIKNMCKKNLFIEVDMEIEERGIFSILLSAKNKREFKKSFNVIFSEKEVQYNLPRGCNYETTEELINCLGYPIYKCIDHRGKKYWYYNEGYVGTRICGFHDCWIEIKRNKVIGVDGWI